MSDIRLVWILLVKIFGAGNPRIWELSANYDNSTDFYTALKNHEIDGITDKENELIDRLTMEDAQKVLDLCKERKINVYCFENSDYPKRLRLIANPPALLFSYGKLDFIDDVNIISLVGTRKPCEYSYYVASTLCRELVKSNIILASGFASGIDQVANKISLEKGAPTIAVCGTAIDFDYPENTVDFKKRIGENGAVISEIIPGTKRVANSFILRNRILVGISRGVVFIEASMESRGLDNYNQATSQGKPVFVIPPRDITDSRFFGQRYLLRNGCIPIFNADDVVGILALDNFDSFAFTRLMGDYTLPAVDSSFYNDESDKSGADINKTHHVSNKHVKTEEKKDAIPQVDYSQLDEKEAAICKILEEGKSLADNISIKTGIEISEVLSSLTLLELEGIVQSLPGNQFKLVD